VFYLINKLQVNNQLNINVLDTALNHAGKGGNLMIIDYLLSLGASDIYNLMTGAIKNGNLDLTKALFSRFPNLNNHIYSNILSIAIKNKNIPIINYLLSKIKENNIKLTLINPIRLAAFNNDSSLVNDLLNIDPTTINLLSALEGSALGGNVDLFKHIIDDLLIKSSPPTTEQLNTALASAAEGGLIEMINYLLSLGATNLKEALLKASSNGQTNAINYILENGINLKKINSTIKLPNKTTLNRSLVLAARSGNLESVKTLIFYGANDILSALRITSKVDIANYLKNLPRF